MRNFWKNHIDSIWNNLGFTHPLRGQTFWMFHLKTNNLEDSQTKNSYTKPVVSIHSMHFVFPFCSVDTGNIVIPFVKQKWETEATRFSDFSSFLPLRVEPYLYITNQQIMWEFFNIKFTLGNLIPLSESSLLDRGLAEFIFPNTTFIECQTNLYTCHCCKLRLTGSNSSLGATEKFKVTYINNRNHPELTIGVNLWSILLTTEKDDFTFLSCGDTYNDPPNFLALFTPFTTTTWALIFITIFGWPLVLSLIENDFNLKNVLKDFDALFIGWEMILEQSHFRATNYKGRGPLYCYCGCVLLAILVLSNAYKGDNIRKLSKAYELVPLTHTGQAIKAGYMTYTRQHCWQSELGNNHNECMNGFELGSWGRRNQYTHEQLELWKPMGLQLTKDVYNQVDIRFFFVFFGNCRRRKAFLGWRSVLEPLQNHLPKRHAKANVYLGQEFIYSRSVGWRLNRYGSVKVFKIMWTLVESGVYNKLLNISYKPPAGKVFEPCRFTMLGNIVVQFVFHLSGPLFALLVFVVELRKRIALCFNPVRSIFSLFIKNFLYQFQEAFLQGLRFLLSEQNDLFDFLRSLQLDFFSPPVYYNHHKFTVFGLRSSLRILSYSHAPKTSCT